MKKYWFLGPVIAALLMGGGPATAASLADLPGGRIANIERILLFAKEPGGVATMRRLEERYRIAPAGANFYYGINPENRDRFFVTGRALGKSAHQQFFDDMLQTLRTGTETEKTVVLGVEPPQAADPYGFVDASRRLVRKLAEELNAYQEEARACGKRLRIVVRYASEMNDDGVNARGGRNRYAGAPEGYKRSFRVVREIFRACAPDIAFTFSPAIRRGLPVGALVRYWPGDDVVDIVSCTWYVGSEGQYAGSVAALRAYLRQRAGKGKRFAIDELGGCGRGGGSNDVFLVRMMSELSRLHADGVSFAQVTIFLEGKWGSDARLIWLRPPLTRLPVNSTASAPPEGAKIRYNDANDLAANSN